MLGAVLHPRDVLFSLRDTPFRATQVPLTPIEHLGASIQAILALADALLGLLKLFPALLGLTLEVRSGPKPMLFSFQQRLLALVLCILYRHLSKALRFI